IIREYFVKVRQLAFDDYFFFCDEIMRDPDYPTLQIGLHDEMCHIAQSDIDALTIIPRGHLKTTLLTSYYAIWKLLHNKNLRILVASDTLDVAKQFIGEIKDHIIHNKRLKRTFPELKPAVAEGRTDFKKWTSTEILIDRTKILKEPSITAVSAGQTKSQDIFM
ncbi:unnamed protein product, partial [marine sediment metagenome]